MTAPHPPVDLVSLLAALLTPIVGVAMAETASTFALIVLAWSVGVLVGLLRMPPDEVALGMRPGVRRVGVFVLGSAGLALGITVPMADVLASVLQQVIPAGASITARSLCFVLAWSVPAVGHSWPAVLARVLPLLRFIPIRGGAK